MMGRPRGFEPSGIYNLIWILYLIMSDLAFFECNLRQWRNILNLLHISCLGLCSPDTGIGLSPRLSGNTLTSGTIQLSGQSDPRLLLR